MGACCFSGFVQDDSDGLGSLGSSNRERVALSSLPGNEVDNWYAVKSSRTDIPPCLCLLLMLDKTGPVSLLLSWENGQCNERSQGFGVRPPWLEILGLSLTSCLTGLGLITKMLSV